MTRVLQETAPFASWSDGAVRHPWDPAPGWPFRWIAPPADWATPLVMRFRCRFTLPAAVRSRIHITADERYDLRLDGRGLGQGPERGDPSRWAYETYDLDLAAGDHEIEARVWALGRFAPWAQLTRGPGFLLAPEHPALWEACGTGRAPWQVRREAGRTFVQPHAEGLSAMGSGGCERHDLRAADEPWTEPATGDAGNDGFFLLSTAPVRLLTPALLLAQLRAEWTRGAIVHRDALADGAYPSAAAPAALPLTVPAGTSVRLLIDLGDYVCGHPWVAFAGGGGAELALGVAEALVDGERRKDDRRAFLGRRFIAPRDRVIADGAERRWTTLWWRSGRWVELIATAAAEPLAITGLGLTEVRYPYAVIGGADTDDARLRELYRRCLRTAETCAHETYVDCPHYEQLQYVGDTRIQALLTYVLSDEARLPAKALDLFDSSRQNPSGLVTDCHPSAGGKLIPPFALWWIGMVRDAAWWRDDPALIRRMLPGVRAVLDRFLARLGADGLLRTPPGWTYIDWTFPGGIPPGGEADGTCAVLQWQLVLALDDAAELEDLHGEPEPAARCRRRRAELVAAVRGRFLRAGRYVESDGTVSEQAQVLACLAGELPDAATALPAVDAVVRCSAYFAHYLFEAYRRIGRTDLIAPRLEPWHALADQGFDTTPEHFGGTRSDCHAWSAHPLFHHLATLCGVRPASPGFASVSIAPQPGALERVAGRVAHPRGTITVALRRTGAAIAGTVTLPPGLPGTFTWNGRTVELGAGVNRIAC